MNLPYHARSYWLGELKYLHFPAQTQQNHRNSQSKWHHLVGYFQIPQRDQDSCHYQIIPHAVLRLASDLSHVDVVQYLCNP